MLQEFWHAIRVSGLIGIGLLALTLMLLAGSIVILSSARSRGPIVVLLVLAFLPLLVGFLGTSLGLCEVETVCAAAGERSDPAIAAEGRRQAWSTTYLGAGATGLLVLVNLAALALGSGGAKRA